MKAVVVLAIAVGCTRTPPPETLERPRNPTHVIVCSCVCEYRDPQVHLQETMTLAVPGSGNCGELDGMRVLPGYQRLRDTCAEHNVEVYESVMSLSGMVNVGQGALVVGFAAEPAKFDA